MTSLSYEVTVRVRKDLVTSFSVYMAEKHIREVLQTGSFIGASFERLDGNTFRARYAAASTADLDRYLEQHAPRLRADVAAHFPDGLEISRETWTRIAEFT